MMAMLISNPSCCGRPLYSGSSEALGYQLDNVGRSLAFIALGAFFSTSLLILAKEAAGCETEIPPGETEPPECDGRILGMRPSSLLTVYSIITGLVGAVVAPVMGALIDFTNHRLTIARAFVIGITLLHIPSIFISSKIWMLVAICQVISALLGQWTNTIRYSYLPELTTDKSLLNKWISSFLVAQFGSMISYILFMVILGTVLGIGDDHLLMTRVSSGVSFVVQTIMVATAWICCLKARKATNTLEPNQSLWTAGFVQVYRTSCKLTQPSFRALRWFYIQTSFADSMIESLATVAITFNTDTLQFTAQENGIAILALLLGSVPGGVVSQVYIRRFGNAIHSNIWACTIMLCTSTLAGILLKGPGQQLTTYIIGFFWGFCIGWKRAGDEFMASTLIPKNQNAELMGLFTFARVCLSWFPPLIFTALNEAGVAQRFIIIALNIMFVASIFGLCMMGSYDEALQKLDEEETGHTKGSILAVIEKSGITEVGGDDEEPSTRKVIGQIE